MVYLARRVDAPTGFDEQMNPLGMATTNFNTSYLLGELGYGIFTARYLYVASKGLSGPQHLHRAGYLPAMMAFRRPQRGDELLWRRVRALARYAAAGSDVAYPSTVTISSSATWVGSLCATSAP